MFGTSSLADPLHLHRLEGLEGIRALIVEIVVRNELLQTLARDRGAILPRPPRRGSQSSALVEECKHFGASAEGRTLLVIGHAS